MRPEIREFGGGIRRVEIVPTNEDNDILVITADSSEFNNLVVGRIGITGLSKDLVSAIANGTKDVHELLRYTRADRTFAPLPGVDLVAEVAPAKDSASPRWRPIQSFREYRLL